MNTERLLIISLAAAISAAFLLTSDPAGASAARQGDGTLAQEPQHLGATVAPNFIMAIDDSGSMTYQTMFPARDGRACWNASAKSFFNNDGTLRTSGTTCNYFYVVPGPRSGNTYKGIPPLDSLGFARSPDYNPSYYDPDVEYEPWIRSDLTSYGNASLANTKVDPRDSGKVELFEPLFRTGTNEDFEVRNGMWIPSGVRYRECSGCGVKKSNGFSWNGGTRDMPIEHVPATFYLKEKRTLPGYTGGVRAAGACGNGCDMWRYHPETNAAKQNFANWFSYYGNRNRAMIAGLTRSMLSVSNMRVGYFTINASYKGSSYPKIDMRDMNSAAEKSLLYKDVLDLGHSGNTPNRRAVAHIGGQFDKNTEIIQHACQKNAGMLFTDGYSNSGGPGGSGNADMDMGVPFADNHPNTLADIAAHYYKKRLRGNDFAAGRVPVSDPMVCESGTEKQKRAADCQTNPHMNFYGVTLGAKGNLFGIEYGVNPDGTTSGALATQQALAGSSSPAWRARENDQPSTVDEIWHATMNARGAYINATTPAAITDAMREVLASVGVGGGVSGSLAITGSRLGDSSLSIEPVFDRNGTDWYGDVVASVPFREPASALTYERKWRASEKLPAPGSRRLWYATTANDSTPAVANFYSDGPDSLDELCANYPGHACGAAGGTDVSSLDITATQAVRYLSGDRTLEGSKLRRRTHPLGDIVNSTPVVSAPTDDYGYGLIRAPDGSFDYDPYGYGAYLEDKEGRPRMVYVGANDGMLHAFNGESGVEEFGFIPSAVVGYMGNLLFPTSPDFQHRYYVDGPVVASDALFGTNDWRTVVVGTTGAGARSVFALDVSDVGTGALAANDVLWEVNDQIPGAVGQRLGHVLGKPVIVPVRGSDGRPVWKAIFGGGYGNGLNASGADTRGTVTLFIVDIKTGHVDYIDARESGRSSANGLGNVVAIDRKSYADGSYGLGADGMADTVYAADLQGNVWKFDLTKTGNDRVATGGPLFTAIGPGGARQPITGGLEVTTGPRGGVMVFFGTGSFSFNGDKQNADVQSIYAVLDVPGETASLPLTRAALKRQWLGGESDGIVNPVTWGNVNYFTQRGWYVDLATVDGDGDRVEAGERIVGYPRLEGGTLMFTSYAPDEGDACSGGGSNYLYGLGALTGAPQLGSYGLGSPPPEGDTLGETTGRARLETSGAAPVKDVNVFTTGKQGALTGFDDEDIDDYDALPAEYCLAVVSVAGADPMYRVRQCGRQSWRQIR